MSDEKRPDRNTMEGMIYNANNLLDKVLDPKTPGVPRVLFRDCKGIVLMNVVEAGFIFSASVGTGIILTQNDKGEWSPPSALGSSGIGFGVLVGAEVKEILILLVDDHAVNSVAGEHQIKFGSQLGIAAGPIGRELGGDLNFSYDRGDLALSYSFSKGLFAGINLEGAVIGARPKINKKFYGKDVKPTEIIMERNVEVPEGCGLAELHKKLDLLKEGKTSAVTTTEKEEVVEEGKQEESKVEVKEASEAYSGDSKTEEKAEEGAADRKKEISESEPAINSKNVAPNDEAESQGEEAKATDHSEEKEENKIV